MKTFHITTAALAVMLIAIPTADAQSSFGLSSSRSDAPPKVSAEKPKPQLNVRDVYHCPTPDDVQGQAEWKVFNTTGLALTVYVADDAGNAYQVLERVGSPAQRAWTPKLQNGTYHLTCVFHNDSAIKSNNFTVSGSTFTNAPKMVPITDREISAVAIEQATQQKKRLPELASKADALGKAVHSGNRADAQAAYLEFYEFFRTFDNYSGLWPGEDVEYGGVEKQLFSDADLTPTLADALVAAVHAKVETLEKTHFTVSAPDYGLRTHEVMEEFERFDMRGERDYGAHALPVALRANVLSTRFMLDPVRELVEGRGLDTAPIYAQLEELDALAAEFDAKYDVAFAEWSQKDRLRLQAAVASANELLAPVATMTVVRRMD